MVKIKASYENLEIIGHTETSLCFMLSCMAQYISSNLDLIEYTCNIGYLKAVYKRNKISIKLIDNFIRFIYDLKTEKIYLIDKRG